MQEAVAAVFPIPLDRYPDTASSAVLDVLSARLAHAPFNGIATIIFVLAILHTFLANRFREWSHRVQHGFDRQCVAEGREPHPCFKAGLLHFLGEVEVVFGLWAVVLVTAMTLRFDWHTATDYVTHGVNYTEPMFIVVIMAIAATRPVVGFAEAAMRRLASIGGASPAAWWLAILTVGPLLGSFITEPAAMTISALLLARQFYDLKPPPRLRYATLGLLFVNVSIGGTLTHFAAPPVLMVARTWDWSLGFMVAHFGWKAVVAIAISNTSYFFLFRKPLRALRAVTAVPDEDLRGPGPRIPAWVVAVHLLLMAFVVVEAHYPVLFIAAFLFFLGFVEASKPYQSAMDLKPPILVGFFLAGLVVHGGLQAWWIGPVLGSLAETPLFLSATFLTAFNDNALITYLATLVPDLSETLKYAVVAGAVTGGGLTVIANAPNPAGQAIVSRYFDEGVSPLGLLAGAAWPTLVAATCFLFL